MDNNSPEDRREGGENPLASCFLLCKTAGTPDGTMWPIGAKEGLSGIHIRGGPIGPYLDI